MKRRAVVLWSDIGHYHAARMQAAAVSSDFVVDAIEVTRQPAFAEFRSEDWAVRSYGRHSLDLTPPFDRTTMKPKLGSLLIRLDPDVVFVPGWSSTAALLATEWCSRNDVPIVLMSDSTHANRNRTPLKEAVKRRIVGLAGAALVAGAPQVEYLVQLGMCPGRIRTGFDVVDNEHFASGADAARRRRPELRNVLGLPAHYFLCIARLVPEKGLHVLLREHAAYRRARGVGAWPLVLVGTGPLLPDVVREVQRMNLGGDVVLAGAKGYGDLPVYYGLADALVLASLSETWGLVVNEAMAAGLPVLVSTRCGCAPDLVADGRNGWTFDPSRDGGLATAMLHMSDPTCDRARMGRASREIIADWGLDRFVTGFAAAADIAIAGDRRAPPAVDRLILRALTWR